jgi:hypothetical protein
MALALYHKRKTTTSAIRAVSSHTIRHPDVTKSAASRHAVGVHTMSVVEVARPDGAVP